MTIYGTKILPKFSEEIVMSGPPLCLSHEYPTAHFGSMHAKVHCRVFMAATKNCRQDCSVGHLWIQY